jgi:hypothetical protein
MEKIINQIKLKFSVLPLYLIFIGVLFSASVFFVWLDNSRSYRSEISIFFAPKSDVAAWQSEQIIGNLITYPTKLSFYEQMIKDDENIEDFLIGKNKETKIKVWNEKLESDRELSSSIVVIKYSDSNKEKAEIINRQSVYTLFGIMSRFYDVKEDIDLRIIEGPIVKKQFTNWPWAIIGSIGGGIVFVVLVQSIASILGIIQQKIISERKLINSVRENLEVAQRQSLEKVQKEVVDEKFNDHFHFPEVRMAVKKSAAPDNLPVMEEGEKAEDFDQEIEVEKNKVPRLYEESDLEPTEEERRERLNRLLRGEM